MLFFYLDTKKYRPYTRLEAFQMNLFGNAGRFKILLSHISCFVM